MIQCLVSRDVESAATPPSTSRTRNKRPFLGRLFKSNNYETTDDDDFQQEIHLRGSGRELKLDLFHGFDTQTQTTTTSPTTNTNIPPPPYISSSSSTTTTNKNPFHRTTPFPPRSGAASPKLSSRRPSTSTTPPNTYPNFTTEDITNFMSERVEIIRTWLRETDLPKIKYRLDPVTTVKIRKTFRPLKTIFTLGADFNLRMGIWQFKSSWEDAIIGGKLTLAGRELQLSKTWLLGFGGVEDLVTRLRFRAAVDIATLKSYARISFRTERLSPLNLSEGITVTKQFPLDGNDGHIKVEVKANFAFPEPEIEFSTNPHHSNTGGLTIGDFEIYVDELNLLLDY